jgi:hypothetical protein
MVLRRYDADMSGLDPTVNGALIAAGAALIGFGAAAAGAEGVLLCQGSNAGGWSLYVKDSRLHYAHNYVGRTTYRVSAANPLPAGRHQLRFEFEPTGQPDLAHGKGSPGRAQLYVEASLPGTPSSRSPRPARSIPEASAAATTPAPRSHPTTGPRSRSPAR